ncbi:MAG: NADH-quinone oxidoreductase subunit NuoG [Magnetococcales bacterium]|nr:NADH-quinone oxidoreductase subunit NuoG [Magnetococcales bacterium]
MPTLVIDDKEISVKPGATIMEAAKQLGVFIPHFCYHPKLPVDGNCRMCLVEVVKMPKPVVSCAMPVNDGMVVKTDSEMVRQARQGVMEFLLINHPLDCPVCDQGGECNLQDFAMKYGPDRSRFIDEKRSVPDRDMGPLIETVMNRCIHCTRCIRFSTEIAGVEEMGGINRGDHMQIGAGVEKTLSSELAGNMAELCPVGALNLKPFHYEARGWELKQSSGLCGQCTIGCRVRRDHLDGAIKRIMVDPCDEINEAWICDKGRFSCDGLTVDRLTEPQLRKPDNGDALNRVGWPEALDYAAEILKGVKPEEVAGLAGSTGTVGEELYAFQDLLVNGIGTPHVDHRLRQRDFRSDSDSLTRADLLMNTSLVDMERADAVLLIGADPRFEAPILNLRIRKAVKAGAQTMSVHARRLNGNMDGLQEALCAPGSEAAFLGEVLQAVKSGVSMDETPESPTADSIASTLVKAERPVVVLGDYAIHHPGAERIRRLAVAILEAAGGLTEAWNGFNRVTSRASVPVAQDMGVAPHRGPGYSRKEKRGYDAHRILKAAASGEIKVLFLLGVDPGLESSDSTLAREALAKARVIYLGAFDSPVVEQADVVLPGLVIGEKEATLTNCEGRVQRSGKAVDGPGDAKEDWRILRALSDRFSSSLVYNDLESLRSAMAKADLRYNVERLDEEMPPACDHTPVTRGLAVDGVDAPTQSQGLRLVVEPSFYVDDPVARRSPLMAKLDKGNRLRVNPKDAESAGVEPGQKVRVIHGERTVEMVAVRDDRIPQGVVFAYYGYPTGCAQDLCSGEQPFPVVSLAGI